LGIDPISRPEKVCNLDCVYCQLGKTDLLTSERKVYVPTAEIVAEVCSLRNIKLDYLTFSGRGEPTLAANLGEMVTALRQSGRKENIAVITNSVLMGRADVRRELALADFVLAKLDACDNTTFGCVNRPVQQANFDNIIKGLTDFRREFSGKLSLQIMFIAANQDTAIKMARLVKGIAADAIEINTPLRPSGVKPLDERQLNEIKKIFAGLPAKTVYEAERKSIQPLDENDTVKRHGDYRKGR